MNSPYEWTLKLNNTFAARDLPEANKCTISKYLFTGQQTMMFACHGSV